METFKALRTKKQIRESELHNLVDILIYASLPAAVKKHSFFINDVAPETKVMVNENIIALVIGNLLCDIASHTENNCIRISASDSETGAILNISNGNMSGYRALGLSLETIQLIAEQVGVNIQITHSISNGSVITVDFRGNKIAA